MIHAPMLPLLAFLFSAFAAGGAAAQTATLLEGPTLDDLRVRIVDARGSQRGVVLPGRRKIGTPSLNGLTSNHERELDRARLAVRRGVPCLELPRATRLLVYERLDLSRHGILVVDPNGEARDVYEAEHQLDLPLAIASDGRHLAFARGSDLVMVRLVAEPAGRDATWHRVSVPNPVLAQSVVVGDSHAFFVTDDDRVWRCALLHGAQAEDITPPGPVAQQDEHLAISGDGRTVAFLRGGTSGSMAIYVAGASGPARRLPGPDRDYRPAGYLPSGAGNPHLLLNHAGTRLMATEAGIEDEIHGFDTTGATPAVHFTGNAIFAAYIGVHILPKFRGNDLLLASGHAGWADWYVARPDGTVQNLTQTGSPEPPFFVGSLDVVGRYPLADGSELSLERIGSDWVLRRLDANTLAQAVVAAGLAPPAAGSSLLGGPDLVVETRSGSRWLSGTSGATRAVLPPGLDMTPPLRGAAGFSATYVHIGGLVGAVVLLFDDGRMVAGSPGLDMPQLAIDASGELLVLRADRLEVHSPGGAWSLPLAPQAVRLIASGATF